ncbi:rCG29271, isoform CRA_a [Rattus norvegicus]|uniref:Sperm microtubule associated protein 2 n=2 Tax=Rattus norvegicus TaxID=10116 RepID=SMAP2_RAT|nr:testicular haploid expressed gene protein isoform X1 [Rattus norvegicus]Q5XHX8.2 RecName: Full=Sperm microtubule associated protein 2; AltName: Full=Testicular haploid expressed gene protein [Rattus norvegicus]EDL89420.1 rCG29271, isoform CRA_a [Rattus norvegicus]|eukprot:XP_006240919.1 PREDICTED: testicular haploid expressed gene protein isoform X1 [Rattus norvegicus]
MGELGEHRSRSSLLSIPVLDTKTSGGSEYRESDGSLDLQSTLFEDHWLQSSQATTERNTDDPEEEIPPEEMVGEELPEVSNLEDSLRRDLEVEVVGMSHLSINERTTPTTSSAKCRKKKNHRLLELAKPKFNWQCLKDRTGRCCKGHVWISPRKTNLQFCLYWPSVYWTERFIEDTTLTITVPEVSRRVEELSRPKRFYQEYYNNNRTTPIWPIPRSTLEYQASNRLKRLATPKIRNNIWSINMSEVSQVSRAAQMAVPTPRTLRLAKPRAPATLLEEWDPMPKPKPYVSDYNRLLQLATPKALSEKCVPDRSPQWEVLNVTKNAVASSRIISLAQPKIRKDLNEGYNPYYISPASLVAQASPRIYELAVPKHITKKV